MENVQWQMVNGLGHGRKPFAIGHSSFFIFHFGRYQMVFHFERTSNDKWKMCNGK
jgi:hypothetical protein